MPTVAHQWPNVPRGVRNVGQIRCNHSIPTNTDQSTAPPATCPLERQSRNPFARRHDKFYQPDQPHNVKLDCSSLHAFKSLSGCRNMRAGRCRPRYPNCRTYGCSGYRRRENWVLKSRPLYALPPCIALSQETKARTTARHWRC